VVYIREAHPTDGWRMESNDRAGVAIAQPKSDAERCSAAGVCSNVLKMTVPCLVDRITNDAEQAFGAFPDRLYLVEADGRVAYQGGRGPFGYHPEELEQAIVLLEAEATLRRF
jgi:hypothetical protein